VISFFFVIFREYDAKTSENNAYKLEAEQKIEKEFANSTAELEEKYDFVSLFAFRFSLFFSSFFFGGHHSSVCEMIILIFAMACL
jgi:hypothetical protein